MIENELMYANDIIWGPINFLLSWYLFLEFWILHFNNIKYYLQKLLVL